MRRRFVAYWMTSSLVEPFSLHLRNSIPAASSHRLAQLKGAGVSSLSRSWNQNEADARFCRCFVAIVILRGKRLPSVKAEEMGNKCARTSGGRRPHLALLLKLRFEGMAEPSGKSQSRSAIRPVSLLMSLGRLINSFVS